MKKLYIGILATVLGTGAALVVQLNLQSTPSSSANVDRTKVKNFTDSSNPVPAIYRTKPLPHLSYNSQSDFVVITPHHAPRKFSSFATAFTTVTNSKNAALVYDTHILYRSGASIPRQVKPLNLPLIQQMPQLPRGCEVTSLAMMLQYEGVSEEQANKLSLAQAIKKDPTPYRIDDGVVHFGNPNVGFVGNMYDFSKPGYGVYHGPIANLASRFFPHDTLDMSGSSFDAVKWALSHKHPVQVITNATFARLPQTAFTTWKTPEGPVRITMQEHSVVITGYDSRYVYFNDPLAIRKNSKVPLKNFVAAWQQMGRQAVTILK